MFKQTYALITLLSFTSIVGIGCEADDRSPSGTDADADSDTDTDTDADADTDADTDTDTDTDTGEYTGPTIPETCADAATILTSVGCEFYAADLNNYDSADGITYAIVVSNPQETSSGLTANVEIEDMRGPGGTLRTLPGMTVSLSPGQLHVFNVTCASGCPEQTAHIEDTGVSALSAFRITSDVPITAYQWNPYGNGLETTDASLLIPSTSLEDEYIGVTWSTGPDSASERAQLTVIGLEDNTQVYFTPKSATLAGSGVPAMAAGVESAPVSLNAFDAVQISPSGTNQMLTGTHVRATKPVAVFGGHSCAMVPDATYYACDHVEEQLLPLVAWGSESVLARYEVRPNVVAASDQALWRIVAGADDMTVTFDPPVTGVGASHSFTSQGEVLQFFSSEDHFASATLDDPPEPTEPEAPFFSVQMMTGRYYVGGSSYDWGDPMLLLSPPAGQFLNRYVFNTDNVFDFSYDGIIIVRPAGIAVELDCLGAIPDTQFTQVGSTSWEVARVSIDNPAGVPGCTDGAHLIESEEPFGLSVVGYDFANSYGYLGGVGVRAINPVIIE